MLLLLPLVWEGRGEDVWVFLVESAVGEVGRGEEVEVGSASVVVVVGESVVAVVVVVPLVVGFVVVVDADVVVVVVDPLGMVGW